jgi:hypothetical protein
MRVIIHSCDKRLWYVRQILVPALQEQGLSPIVHNDDAHAGCLMAYMDSFRSLDRESGGTWHLQDDVYPCRDFAKIAQEHDEGIVYGFWFRHFEEKDLQPGYVSVREARYSFPCLRIPDSLTVEFTDWFLCDAQFREMYRRWVKEKKFVDSFWMNFLRERHPELYVYNLKPSIVDHVDEWLGGSVINFWRDGWSHATYFDDDEAIAQLKVKLAGLNGPLF